MPTNNWKWEKSRGTGIIYKETEKELENVY